MLHAGVLMKLGGYGCFRVAMYLMPEAAHELSWIFIVLTTISVVYGALHLKNQQPHSINRKLLIPFAEFPSNPAISRPD